MTSKLRIFHNATIYLDQERTVKNMAVRNGTVCALNVDTSKCRDADIVDLKGGVVFPGFNDSHVHLVEAGFAKDMIDFHTASNARDIADILKQKAKNIEPNDAPIIGAGFSLSNQSTDPNSYDNWSLKDLKLVDEASGEHPVMIIDKLGHNCIVNTLGLKMAGITESNHQPPFGGEIITNNGKPTGMLRESAMTLAGNRFIPLFGDQVIKNGALKEFSRWAEMGYTSVVDLMGAPLGQIMKPELCMQLEAEDRLPVRVNYLYTFFDLEDLENVHQYIGNDTDMVRFAGLKLFVDGAFAGGLAWTSWENTNDKNKNGLAYVHTDDDKDKKYNLNLIVKRVNELGLDIHYHVQGDMAINAVLEAIHNAKTSMGFITSTHTLIHLAFINDQHIEIMKNLAPHVAATVQPGFWIEEKNDEDCYGEHAVEAYPIHKLFQAGIPTGISTDYSVSSLEHCLPMTIMEIAASGAGGAKEHVHMRDVVLGLTAGSAATVPTTDTGKLEVGFKADFVVYDKDPYTVPIDKFDTNAPCVLSTWVNGKQVYPPCYHKL